jgi:cell division protein YceG involved in septum cleavage
MKKLLLRKNYQILFLFLLLLAATSFLLCRNWQDKFTAPRKEAPTVQFRIGKDTTLTAVIGNLHYYGFIKDQGAFQYALEHTKDPTPGREGAIKINNNTIDTQTIYKISQTMNAWQLSEVLLNGGTFSDCSHGCPESIFDPELLPGGNQAPTLQERYEWVKTYEDCVTAIGHDGGQLSSEQYYQRTGIRKCVSPDSREFTEGKEGWVKAVGG